MPVSFNCGVQSIFIYNLILKLASEQSQKKPQNIMTVLLTLTIVDTNKRTRPAMCRRMIPSSRSSIFSDDLDSNEKRRRSLSVCVCVCQIGGTWVCRCRKLFWNSLCQMQGTLTIITAHLRDSHYILHVGKHSSTASWKLI